MRRTSTLRRAVALVVVATALTAGCSSGSDSASTKGSDQASDKGTVVKVVLTNAGCTVVPDTVASGRVTFSVTNTGDGAVTELELKRGGRIVAERENVAPGFKASFSVTPAAGSYSLYCPGGGGPADHPFTVTAAAATSTSTP